MRSVIGIVLLGVLGISSVVGQDGVRTLHYPEDLREDLAIFREALHGMHADPYRYHTRSEMDRAFDSVAARLRVPLSTQAFADELIPVLRMLGDAHTVLHDPQRETEEFRRAVPLIPLNVAVSEGGLYVVDELKGFRSLPTGSRILAINKFSAEEILDRITKGIPCDGMDTGFALRTLEGNFPELYDRFVERASEHVVRHTRPDGRIATERLIPLTRVEMENSMRIVPSALPSWRYNEYPEVGTVWLTLNTFDEDLLAAEGLRTDRFLKDLLAVLHDDGTKFLVVDVRGAGGAELHTAENIHALYAIEPYRVVQNMVVRSTALPPGFVGNADSDAFYASAGVQFLPDRNEGFTLRPDDTRLELLPPMAKPFAGKVFIIQDGSTREAGAALSILGHRARRVKLVGEATGTNAFGFCGGRSISVAAPNTGLVLEVPLMRYIWEGAPAGPTDQGEQPDYRIRPSPGDIAKGGDPIKRSLLEFIRELQ